MKRIILGSIVTLLCSLSFGLQAQGDIAAEDDQKASLPVAEKAQILQDKAEVVEAKNPVDTTAMSEGADSITTPPAKESQKTKAVTPDNYYQRDTVDTGSSLVSMVIGLALILGLIAAVAWGMKRFSSMSPSMGKHIKVVSATAVGNRERIALVEVGDKSILIGVTPHNISKLHVFDKDEIPEEAPPSEFARKLQSMLSKGNVKQ